MPDPQLILVVLLLAAAVMYGYFYFKRAQADPPTCRCRLPRRPRRHKSLATRANLGRNRARSMTIPVQAC